MQSHAVQAMSLSKLIQIGCGACARSLCVPTLQVHDHDDVKHASCLRHMILEGMAVHSSLELLLDLLVELFRHAAPHLLQHSASPLWTNTSHHTYNAFVGSRLVLRCAGREVQTHR